jgi:hypothetical protein
LTGGSTSSVAGFDPQHHVARGGGHPDGVVAERHLAGGLRERDPRDLAAGAGADLADGPVAGGGHPDRPTVAGDGQPRRRVWQPDLRHDLVGGDNDAGDQPAAARGPADDPDVVLRGGEGGRAHGHSDGGGFGVRRDADDQPLLGVDDPQASVGEDNAGAAGADRS